MASSFAPLSDLRSALDRLTRPPLAAVAAALILALLLAVVGAHLVALRDPSGGNFELGTGDFLAFWTGASAIAGGDGARLYEFAFQQELQARILGGRAGDFQPYLNPPLLAILLSPATHAGYVGGFFLFDAACVLAFLAGLLALVHLTPAIAAVRGGTWTLVLVIASWQPMLQTTLGGQNTAITFALLAAMALALHRQSGAGAAIVLALLTYKPQYAVGLSIALLLSGRVRVVAAGVLGGALHWLAAAWWCGLRWPLDMLAFMSVYRPMELAENAATHFSWVRTADFLLPSPLDTIAAAAGVAAVLALWWRFRDLGRRGDPVWFAMAVTGTMLVSPHQQYYDAALLVLPVALLAHRTLEEGRTIGLGARIALACAYVGYPAWELADRIGFQPLFVVLLAVFAWSVRIATAAGAASARAETRNAPSGPAVAGGVGSA